MQIAPATAQSLPAASVMVTSSSEAGSTVISNRSLRSSTRCAWVTVPPVTVSASSRSEVGLMPTSSMKATRRVNSLSPSWDRGTPTKRAVSRSTAWPGIPPEGQVRPVGTVFELSAISTHCRSVVSILTLPDDRVFPHLVSSSTYNGPNSDMPFGITR